MFISNIYVFKLDVNLLNYDIGCSQIQFGNT